MKALRIAWGFSLVAVGIVLLFLPGPGLSTIITGLVILARHFRWASIAIAKLRNYLLATARLLDSQLAPRRRRRKAA